MQKEELLNDWLILLYSSLKNKNKEIDELESKASYAKELNGLQISRLNNWLEYEDLEADLREELEFSKKHVEKIPEKDDRSLELLKKSKKATQFMIEKIEAELRG